MNDIMAGKLKEIAIEILQRCPNCCIHCSSFSDLHKTALMPLQKIVEVVNDAKDLGASRVCISGGEPFLHPDIVQILRYVHEIGLECYLYSSGIYYEDGFYGSVPESLLTQVHPYLTKLIVNYETTDPVKYNKIMGTDCDGLHLLEETVKRTTALGMVVEAHFVPMHINVQDAESVIDRCKELGMQRVSFLRLVMQGRAPEHSSDTAISEEEINEFLSRVKSRSEKSSSRLGIPFSKNSFHCACTAGIQKISVRYDGNVYPCESFKNDEPIGLTQNRPENIYRKSLKDIYLHSPYLEEVRALIKEFKSNRHCESCINQYYRAHKLEH